MTNPVRTDPFPYAGPLRAASDGREPRNNHWYPDIWYWMREWDRRAADGITHKFHATNLGLLELNNGAWLNTFTGTHTYSEQYPSRAAAFSAGVAGIRRFARNMTFRPINPEHPWMNRPLPMEDYVTIQRWLTHLSDLEAQA